MGVAAQPGDSHVFIYFVDFYDLFLYTLLKSHIQTTKCDFSKYVLTFYPPDNIINNL